MPHMTSSGPTPISTSSPEPVILMKVGNKTDEGQTNGRESLQIWNTGAHAGLFRTGADEPWVYLPVGITLLRDIYLNNVTLSVMRIGSNDLTGIFAAAW